MAQIQWFPGHMTKAKREMEEKIKMVDMIIELRDARLPQSSANPLLQDITKDKPRLLILTKADKAEAKCTKEWLNVLNTETTKALAYNINGNLNVQEILDASTFLLKEKLERYARKGIRNRSIRAMIIGIPNVGKSTLINRLAKRKAADTGDRPGVTKSTKWIKVNNVFELLDTPGVLWPKFDDTETALRLAVSGAIKDEILPKEEVTEFALSYLAKHYPHLLEKRYEIEVCEDHMELLQRIGASRKLLKSGGDIDIERTRDMVIREIRDNMLGPISWEVADGSR